MWSFYYENCSDGVDVGLYYEMDRFPISLSWITLRMNHVGVRRDRLTWMSANRWVGNFGFCTHISVRWLITSVCHVSWHFVVAVHSMFSFQNNAGCLACNALFFSWICHRIHRLRLLFPYKIATSLPSTFELLVVSTTLQQIPKLKWTIGLQACVMCAGSKLLKTRLKVS